MNREFVFKPKDIEVVNLDADAGVFSTPVTDAEVEYKFDKGDNTVRLHIHGMWFKAGDIDDLISFLNAAKAAL